MKPTDFPESNQHLRPPANMPNCTTLDVYTDGAVCLSKWKPTEQEREAIMAGADIFLLVRSGTTQPPVFLVTEDHVRINPDTGDVEILGEALIS